MLYGVHTFGSLPPYDILWGTEFVYFHLQLYSTKQRLYFCCPSHLGTCRRLSLSFLARAGHCNRQQCMYSGSTARALEDLVNDLSCWRARLKPLLSYWKFLRPTCHYVLCSLPSARKSIRQSIQPVFEEVLPWTGDDEA